MNDGISVFKASTDEQILQTRNLMLQLRPNVREDGYLPTVRRMIESNGYHLAAVVSQGDMRAVAGYRYLEMLYCGKIMYVDDLNTDERDRSTGLGKLLLDWLKNEARSNGCGELHLDSGVQRGPTHRFYFRERLTISAFHFRVSL